MIKRLRRFVGGGYDPVEYWNHRSDPNNEFGRDPARVEFDTAYIADGIGDSDPVLELGPGVGRTFEAYAAGRRVTAVDLSRRYSEQLKEVAGSLDITLTQVHLARETDAYPFEDGAFPVGVASQVLLHVPPSAIEHTIAELMRVCAKVVVVTMYRHGSTTAGGGSHVFNHDYFRLCTDAGGVMHRVLKRDGRIYFTLYQRQAPL